VCLTIIIIAPVKLNSANKKEAERAATSKKQKEKREQIEKVEAELLSKGDAGALYNYGVSLKNDSSYTKAITWFEKAAAKGHTAAQSKISECREEIKKIDERYKKDREHRAQEAAQKAAIPKCAHCRKSLPDDMTWARMVDTPQGRLFFCCSMCAARAGYAGQGI